MPELESAIYRIVQESLTNVIKHADAEHVEIAIVEDGEVTITVHDDGSGFDPSQRGDGFGLLGMRERVSLVGGELRVESEPGGGTTVIAVLPAQRLASDSDEPGLSRRPA